MKRNKIPGGSWKVCTYISRQKEKLLVKVANNKGISRSELLSNIIDRYLSEKH